MNCKQWLNCVLSEVSKCPYCKHTPCVEIDNHREAKGEGE